MNAERIYVIGYTKRIKFMISYFKEKIYAQKAAGVILNSK
jgi:hypothetical protein